MSVSNKEAAVLRVLKRSQFLHHVLSFCREHEGSSHVLDINFAHLTGLQVSH